MKLLKCMWILWTFALCSAYAPKDICNAKPKDMPLKPMCVYRNPDFSVEPTRAPEKIPVANPRVLELSKANSGFALTLFKQLSERKSSTENIFLSPISISTAFAMTKLGACNRTLEQLMKHETMELISANRLFGDKSMIFNEAYQNISEKVYGAKMMPLNFKENPDDSRKVINEWIANKTEDRIKDTLPEGSIDSDTILVLVNAIYFKGQWKHKFNKEDVMNLDFHVSETLSCPVPMMYQERKFQYASIPDDKVKILELPYNGRDITMVLILPNEGTPLSEVVANMNLKTLVGWLNIMNETTVTVQIPRFRIEDSMSLKEVLAKMGLEDLFSATHASLPGMVAEDGPNLYISDAYHKAFLEVNEEGSEAAAATAVVSLGRSLNVFRESFIANRPFILMIRDSSINALLFTGRVANPCGSS
ncbi:Antithrombin-III [Triplophysa tibetana]|uniref:Antithrombin-III n=1 Tax=Triplophysa tibetana TaxID=1572043 RepID=A0A5A9NT42_9TELE|nr:Antithrombin-III [Triplophysa tibetana]